MKKIYTILLGALPFLSVAQTITQADLPTAGTAYVTAQDTTFLSAIPAGGTGQTWNFSGLLNQGQDTSGYIAAAGTPYAASFPASNLASYDAVSSNYVYMTNSSSGLYADGIGSASGVTSFNPPWLQMPVPFSFNDTRSNVSRIVQDTLGVRIVLRIESSFLADGSGSLTTPAGTYNVLRVKTTALTYDSVYIDLGGGIYTPFSGSASQTTNFIFVSSGLQANFIMSITGDSLGLQATGASYLIASNVSVQEPAVKKQFNAYPNPAFDQVKLSTLDLNGEVFVYDMNGREVKRVKGNVANAIQVDEMKAGTYNYRVIIGNRTESGQFIVNH